MSPIYGYKCSKCGHCFDKRNSVEERRFMRCPECDYLAEMVMLQPFNYKVALRWPEDRREHFGRIFDGRRCDRPKAFGE